VWALLVKLTQVKLRSPLKPKSKSTMALWPRELDRWSMSWFISPEAKLARDIEVSTEETYHMTQAAIEKHTLARDPAFTKYILGGIGRRPRAVRHALLRAGFRPGTPVLLIDPENAKPVPALPYSMPGVCC
jgi:hypothetical protein